MNIVFILDNYYPYIGGVENVFKNITEKLALEKNNEITVITSKSGLNLPNVEIINNIKIFRVCKNRYFFSFFSFPTIIKYSKKADILHTTTYNAALATFLANIFLQKKTIIHVHEIFDQLWYKFLGIKGVFYKLFESFILSLPYDKYICVSYSTAEILKKFKKIPIKKISVIYSGIDYSIWDKNKYSKEILNTLRQELNITDKYTCLFYGRPGISKGLEYYLKAIPLVVKKIPNFHALLIVSRDDPKRLQVILDLIFKLNIKKYITLHEPVKYTLLPTYILSVNLVIVPSISEGFGFCAAETSALNQHLVVSDTTSLPEAVSGQINFSLPGNPNSISKAIIKSFNHEFITIPRKNFYWSDSIIKLKKIYESCLSY